MDLSQLASERASDSTRLGLMHKRPPPPLPKRHARQLLLKAPPLKAPSLAPPAPPPGLPSSPATHTLHTITEMRIKAPPREEHKRHQPQRPPCQALAGAMRLEDNVTKITSRRPCHQCHLHHWAIHCPGASKAAWSCLLHHQAHHRSKKKEQTQQALKTSALPTPSRSSMSLPQNSISRPRFLWNCEPAFL